MDELTREKLGGELHDIREQLRALRQEALALDERVMHGDEEAERELAATKARIEALRPRHDELADALEGRVEASSGGAVGGVLDFLADYKWPLVGVAAMGVVVYVMFLVSQPQVTDEERAKVKAALTGAATERIRIETEAAQDRMARSMRETQRAMDRHEGGR